MEEKNKSFITLILAAILLVLAIVFNDSKSVNLLWGSLVGVSSTLFINFGLWLLNAWKNISTIFHAFFIRRLRLSCSYLYRIKVDNLDIPIKLIPFRRSKLTP